MLLDRVNGSVMTRVMKKGRVDSRQKIVSDIMNRLG